jgi:hypothetical protein
MSKKKRNRNKTVTLVNPEVPDAQVALDAYKPTEISGAMLLFVSCNVATLFMMISSGTLGAGDPVVILLYTVWAGVILGAALLKLQERQRQRRYNRHVEAGNIITVDTHLVEEWDELRKEHGVELRAGQRHVEIHKLFTAATELHDDLERLAESENEEALAETRLLARARIRARLLREVETLRAVQEAQRDIAQLPASDIDIVTPEEVQAQLRVLRAQQGTDADSTPSREV